MTRTLFALVAALVVSLTVVSGRAQAVGGTYRIHADGDPIIGWSPDSGAIDQTSNDQLSAAGTMTSQGNAVGHADYELASGPGIVRAKVDGSFTVPSNLAYPFAPQLQAISTTELTVTGPDGYVDSSVNLHVDGVIAEPVCGDRPSCGAEEVAISIGPFTRSADFTTLGDTRVNELGLAFDRIPGGYHVHGEVTSAPLGIRTNTPYPVTIVLSLGGRYAGGPAPTTIGGNFGDQAARYQVSFSPSGPVLNDIPAGYSVSGPNVVDNQWTDPFAPVSPDVVVTNCADPALAQMTSVAGNLIFRNLPGCPTISMPNLVSVGGDLIIEDTAASDVNLSSLTTVSGSINVTSSGNLDLSSLTTVVGNASVTAGEGGDLDLSSLTTVSGSMTVTGSGDLDLSTVTSVSGSINVTGSGDLDLGTTGAGGPTDVTMLDTTASMHVILAQEAFDEPVGFTITLHTDPAQIGSDADGSAATIDPIIGYQFVFDVPTLNADANLAFTIDMAALDSVERANLLNSLGSGVATIVGKADAAGSMYAAFPVCAGSQTPAANQCVAIEYLTADGTPTTGNPAFVRFSGVVGHFSTYAIATITPRDVTPPTITVPAGVVVDATSPAGATVSYTVSASDDLDPAPSASCTPASGGIFAIGTTTVACTASDASGNSANAHFDVRVRGAAEQIERLLDRTLSSLDRPSLRPAFQASLRRTARAIVAGRPKLACAGLEVYKTLVRHAPSRTLSELERVELLADATRIQAVIGCR